MRSRKLFIRDMRTLATGAWIAFTKLLSRWLWLWLWLWLSLGMGYGRNGHHWTDQTEGVPVVYAAAWLL